MAVESHVSEPPPGFARSVLQSILSPMMLSFGRGYALGVYRVSAFDFPT